MEIPGGWGSNAKPSGTENPVGWGVKLEKTLHRGGMDIFWNHTLQTVNQLEDCQTPEIVIFLTILLLINLIQVRKNLY